jgi:uncharacterized repeat protein (TIGR01451 family)
VLFRSQISANPAIGTPVSPANAACGFGAGGTTFSYPVIPVIAGGGAGIIEFDVQYPVLTAGTVVSNAAKAVSVEIPAGVTSYAPSNVVTSAAANLIISKSVASSTPAKGESVTYTVTVSNIGSTAANLAALVDTLPGAATAVLANQIPSRFNYVATSAVTVNGAPLSGVTANVAPPAAPATTNNETVTWTFPSGSTIPAGGQLVLTFTATAGGGGRDQRDAVRYRLQQYRDHQLRHGLRGNAGRAGYGDFQYHRVDRARHPDHPDFAVEQNHRLCV